MRGPTQEAFGASPGKQQMEARIMPMILIKLRFSNYGSATTAQQLRLSNHGSATTAQQPRLSNQTRFSLQQLRFSNYASATKTNFRFSNYGSATKIYSRFSNQTSATKTHPFWQVHAQSHLTHHIKIPPPLASTCTVSSSTSYQNPTPSGKYMHSLILHVISKSHPLWQVHAQSHLTHHIKIPPPLASTCTVSSYTSYQNPTPSGNYMHSLIFHVTSKSHPLWQVHVQSHLTRNLKIPPPLASTCTFSSYTSYQNPTPSGKYMHSLILHIISKSHPLWQVHAQSHLPRHINIPPLLASTCTVSSYT